VLYFVGDDGVRIAFAFLLFRIFDIVKPPPIRQIDAALKNGSRDGRRSSRAGYTLIVLALWQRALG